MNEYWWTILGGVVGISIGCALIIVYDKSYRIKTWRYNLRIQRQNEKNRRLRVAKPTWNGYPLPMGKQGSLRITQSMMRENPVSWSQLDKAFRDRQTDLKIDMTSSDDPLTGDIIVSWKPARKTPNRNEIFHA